MQGGGFDIPLNSNGRLEAQAVADELSEVEFGVIVSSHLSRAVETADILLLSSSNISETNKSIRIIRSEFGEMRFGNFEGLALRGPLSTEETREQFQSYNDLLMTDPNLRWPGDGGESTLCVERRAMQALHQIFQEYEGEEHIAVVAHGRTNKIILSSLINGNPSMFASYQQGNTCINVLDFDSNERSWSPVLLNYVDHTNGL